MYTPGHIAVVNSLFYIASLIVSVLSAPAGGGYTLMLGELHSSLNTYASTINESTNSLYLNREPNRAEFTGKGNPLMDHCVTEMNVPNVTLYINFFTSSYTQAYTYT